VVNANVEACLVENNLLEQASSLGHETTIFIASLTSDLQEHLRGFYERSAEFEHTKISFQQLSSEKEQRFGLEVYQQVLVEVLRLSFSHTLLLSPASTFGGLGQAYGALTSWFIETRDDVRTPCQRGQTSDACFQTPDHSYRCPYETERTVGKSIIDIVPYIKPCLQIDARGMQLMDGLKNASTVNLQLR
jgi:xyloglucan fucosyltransferase